jgi:hypothetical protein
MKPILSLAAVRYVLTDEAGPAGALKRVEQDQRRLLVAEVARVDRLGDADGRDARLGDGAADDQPADVRLAER